MKLSVVAIIVSFLLLSGCSIRRFAVRKAADALSSSGGTFESDEDVELVGSALPFGLKLYESLLADVPKHSNLLLSLCQGFTSYAYGYVDLPAERLEATDLEGARLMRARGLRLYQRAHGYCGRALETKHPGLMETLLVTPGAAVRRVTRREEVPLLYWSAASLGLQISAGRNLPALVARIPEVEALIDRAVELDANWGKGSLFEFQLVFAGAKPGGGNLTDMRRKFDQALNLSGGRRAGVYVAYAESALLPQQKKTEFRQALEKALAVDTNAEPESKLVNVLAQRRARWLLDRIDDLILEQTP